MATPPLKTPQSTAPSTVNWRYIGLFVLGSYALAWLAALPLYLTDDDALFAALYLPVGIVTMLVPGLVAWLIVLRTRPRGHRAAALGFRRHRPTRRFIGYLVLAFVIPLGIALLSLPLAAVLGLYEFDLQDFAGVRGLLAEAGVADIPLGLFFFGQVINVLLAAWVINLLPALGEEIGWRGWLTPQLLPLGVLPTIGLTGLIWGLWHTPLMLLGHNFPHLPAWLSVVCMVIFCTVIGAVLAWLTIRTGSVWPAALGHSTVNAIAGLPVLFSAEPTFDTAQVGITGLTGWIITVLIVAIMLATRSFIPAPQPAVDPNTAWPGDYSPSPVTKGTGSRR